MVAHVSSVATAPASAEAISAVRGAVQALGSGAVPVPTTWISNGVFAPIEVSVAPSLFSKALLAAGEDHECSTLLLVS